MTDQTPDIVLGSGAIVKIGRKRSRFEGYALVNVLNLQANADAHIGAKVLLRGTLFKLQSDGASSWLEVSVPHESVDPPGAELVRVSYDGELSGLARGCGIRIWGTCAGMYSDACIYTNGKSLFPLVKADILQW